MGAIRRALADAVERSGLRPVARDVGVTHPALLSIIEGTEPRPSTTRKLVEWYLRYEAAGGGDVDVETVRAVLSVMLRHVPEERQSDARRELLEALERISKAAGVPVPSWLRKLRE